MNQNKDLIDLVAGLLKKDRSYRRFDNSVQIDCETLSRLVALTRYCSSGRNLQPLKYRIVPTSELCKSIFPLLAWAGYYKDWDGPAPHERPSAYIIQCLDTELTSDCMCDDGLHLQAISLGAAAMGLGGCIIKAFNAKALADVLALPSTLKPLYVYALGKPAEEVVITDLRQDGDYKYYRDSTDRQCVPKRDIDDVIISDIVEGRG